MTFDEAKEYLNLSSRSFQLLLMAETIAMDFPFSRLPYILNLLEQECRETRKLIKKMRIQKSERKNIQ